MSSNSPTPAEICEAFISATRGTFAEGMRKIEHCVGQLNDEQIWWRPRPEMNSIANLMLHLSGNLRQWIVAGIGGAKDVRNRPLEFSDRSNRKKADVNATLKKTVAEADAVLAKLTAEQLILPRRIQGFETNVIAAIMSTIPHFRGHVQEIIHITRQQLGEKYRFDFVPKGKEQESVGGV
ncbi:MAG: DUF1572 family protein [Tepidisphaeraceae bacterium]|jgi:hypothetical protein